MLHTYHDLILHLPLLFQGRSLTRLTGGAVNPESGFWGKHFHMKRACIFYRGVGQLAPNMAFKKEFSARKNVLKIFWNLKEFGPKKLPSFYRIAKKNC